MAAGDFLGVKREGPEWTGLGRGHCFVAPGEEEPVWVGPKLIRDVGRPIIFHIASPAIAQYLLVWLPVMFKGFIGRKSEFLIGSDDRNLLSSKKFSDRTPTNFGQS